MKQKNQRRIPMEKEFMKCNDRVYSYLQTVSSWTPGANYRHIKKSDYSNAQIGRELKIDQRTVGSAIRKLKKIGAIEDEKGYYRLPEYGARFRYIPNDTLEFMISALSVDSIKVYCILSAWKDMGLVTTFTRKGVCTELGVKPGGNQYTKIDNILTCLVNNGLIELEEEQTINKYNELETIFTLQKVNSTYKER